MQDYVRQAWPESNVHNVFLCGTSCIRLSNQEHERLLEREKNKKKPDKFRHEWLSEVNWSIIYVEAEGFFCVLCRKHSQITKNLHNKKSYFANTPSIRLKEDTLKNHSCTSGHLSAIQIELTQIKSPFHKDYIDKEESITSTYERVFATAYFLMKEYIANRKTSNKYHGENHRCFRTQVF